MGPRPARPRGASSDTARRLRAGLLVLGALLLLAPSSAMARLGAGRVVSRLVGRSASNGGARLLGASALRNRGGAAARAVLTRTRSGSSRLLSPLRRARLRNTANSVFPNKGKGVQAIRRGARGNLRAGEDLAGVHHVWYRTSSGRVIRAKPNRFQGNVWESAQGKLNGAETIAGVEGASFVTSTGRVVHASSTLSPRRILRGTNRMKPWIRYIGGPALGAFLWRTVDRVTLITAANEIKERTDAPGEGEEPQGGEGDETVVHISEADGEGGKETVVRIEDRGDHPPQVRLDVGEESPGVLGQGGAPGE